MSAKLASPVSPMCSAAGGMAGSRSSSVSCSGEEGRRGGAVRCGNRGGRRGRGGVWGERVGCEGGREARAAIAAGGMGLEVTAKRRRRAAPAGRAGGGGRVCGVDAPCSSRRCRNCPSRRGAPHRPRAIAKHTPPHAVRGRKSGLSPPPPLTRTGAAPRAGCACRATREASPASARARSGCRGGPGRKARRRLREGLRRPASGFGGGEDQRSDPLLLIHALRRAGRGREGLRRRCFRRRHGPRDLPRVEARRQRRGSVRR